MPHEVAQGVFRLGAMYVNWFIVEEGGRLTLVDAGNPNQYDQLPTALQEIGRSLSDVDAIVLTHAHGDHLGSSAKIKQESGADVRVHSGDAALARGEAHREYERHYIRDLTHLNAWRGLLFFLRGGALRAAPVAEPTMFDDGETLDVPGKPRVIHTPGHTDGSACLLLEERGVLFTGDSLVTLNILTRETGPRVMPGAFNKSSRNALASLSRLKQVDADVILPGHGEPWMGTVDDAVSAARAAGPS